MLENKGVHSASSERGRVIVEKGRKLTVTQTESLLLILSSIKEEGVRSKIDQPKRKWNSMNTAGPKVARKGGGTAPARPLLPTGGGGRY